MTVTPPPVLQHLLDYVHSPNDPAQPTPTWTDISAYVHIGSDVDNSGFTFTRGRDYQLDAAQAAELDVYWSNTDGRFTPGNASSPYAPLPVMSQYMIQALYGTNLLSRNDSLQSEDASSWQAANSNGTVTWTGSQGFGSPGCVQVTTGTAGTVGLALAQPRRVAVTAGNGFSCWVAVLAAATPRAWSATVTYFNSGGSTVGSPVTVALGSDATIWTQYHGTFGTVPAAAVAASVSYTVASTAINEIHYANLMGLYPAATVASWTPPAAESPYPFFTGYISQFKQLRDMDGTWPYVYPEIVDALAPLSQPQMLSQYKSTVLLKGPYAYYPLDETDGSLSFGSIAATSQPAALVVSSPDGFANNEIVSGAAPLTPALEGAQVYFSNAGTLGQWIQLGSGGVGPYLTSDGGCTVEMWVQVTSADTGGLLYTQPGPNPVFTGVTIDAVNVGTGVQFIASWGLVTGIGFTSTLPFGVHHLVATLANDQKTTALWVDGVLEVSGIATNPIVMPTNQPITLGGAWSPDPTLGNFHVEHVALYQYALDAAQVADNYLSGSTGYAGDTTDERFARTLGWVPWFGGSKIDPGASVVQAAIGLEGNAALDVLQDLATNDEDGALFINAAGQPEFQGRHYAELQPYPRFIFGENDQAGEIPYWSDIEIDTDAEYVTNTAVVTRNNGATAYASNPASIKQFFPLPADDIVSNVDNDNEIIDRVNWTVTAYGSPAPRIEQITIKPSHLNPSTCPLAWYAILSLEVGDRVAVQSRADGTPPVDCVIDQINPTVGDDPGSFAMQYQLSPIPLQPWIVGAGHTTLHTTVSATATSLVLNAYGDAATNPVESRLAAGQLHTITDPGGVEQVGVLSVTSSSPGSAGYSTVTVGVQPVIGTGALLDPMGMAPAGVDTVNLQALPPTGVGAVLIDGEVMTVTAVAGPTAFTVTRGLANTSQAPHITGATVSFLGTSGLAHGHTAGVTVTESLADTPDGRTVYEATRWDAYSVLGAWWTTLAVSCSSGATSITIWPTSDYPTNNPPLLDGDTLWLNPASADIVAVTGPPVLVAVGGLAAFQVPVTATGHSHAAGVTVSEPLPSGVTVPANLPGDAIVGY